jgi:hypothetical protein
MNVLDLVRRELNRIAADFRAWSALPAGDERRPLRGLSLCGRITAYLHAEERVLYPALIAVAFALRPAVLAHQRRLKRRTGDAAGRLRMGDDLGDAALLKLEQETLRYARYHELDLTPGLQSALNERELQLLGGEMLMTLAAHRMPEGWRPLPAAAVPAWAHSSPASERRRFRVDVACVPTLCDVVEAHDPLPMPRRLAASGSAGAAWAA